MTEVEVHFVN